MAALPAVEKDGPVGNLSKSWLRRSLGDAKCWKAWLLRHLEGDENSSVDAIEHNPNNSNATLKMTPRESFPVVNLSEIATVSQPKSSQNANEASQGDSVPVNVWGITSGSDDADCNSSKATAEVSSDVIGLPKFKGDLPLALRFRSERAVERFDKKRADFISHNISGRH